MRVLLSQSMATRGRASMFAVALVWWSEAVRARVEEASDWQGNHTKRMSFGPRENWRDLEARRICWGLGLVYAVRATRPAIDDLTAQPASTVASTGVNFSG
jgi:hypothetical protein